MEKKRPLHRSATAITLACMLTLSGCLPGASDGGRGKGVKGAAQTPLNNAKKATGGKTLTGPGATVSPPSVLDGLLEEGQSELKQFVDPFDGTYKKKITIPKNFKGMFYMGALNLSSLQSKNLRVRFKFGRELEAITVDAIIGRAPGLVPQIDMDVLIMDMHDAPFKNMRLLYDLFDYNDYRDGGATETKAAVTNPRDVNLFCRGLHLQHDHTYKSNDGDSYCNSAGERCLYTFAKIKDSGLFYVPPGGTTEVALTPTLPQIDFGTAGYGSQPTTTNIKKCLPDNFSVTNFNGVMYPAGAGPVALSYNQAMPAPIGGVNYFYRGPFRTLSSSSWEITGNAAISQVDLTTGPSGIFQQLAVAGNLESGYRSFLFPRAGKMPLKANVDYFGSSDPFGTSSGGYLTRTKDALVSAGDSLSMDGCNLRVTNYDSTTNEGISSCNVTATIELLYLDENGVEQLVPDSTISNLKLQLIRPSTTNFEGKEVLYQSLKTCNNSNSCGVDECCFNQRCWSKSLVSVCLEDLTSVGNRGVGEVCSNDIECAGLCCGASTGTCQVHVNNSQTSVLCTKGPGQQCIAKEWCRQEAVSKCYIVKTGFSPQGAQQCALRCYNVPTYGECVAGTCVAPTQPQVPFFDPANPDCSTAIEAPTTVN